MRLFFKKNILFCTLFFLTFSFNSSCKNSLQKKYGEDENYFFGIKALYENKINLAKKYFFRCSKKGSEWPARRSLEALCKIASPKEKTKFCIELAKKYDDYDAKFLALKELAKQKEFFVALSVTEKIDFKSAPNELAKMRLEILREKNSVRFENEVLEWFLCKKISGEHFEFFKNNKIFFEQNANLAFALKFRIAVYEKNYGVAFSMFEKVREIFIEQRTLPLTFQIIADMGRTLLNASKNNLENANFFCEIFENENFSEAKTKYYALIYSGLLFKKDSENIQRAQKQFETALSFSENAEDFDQALWYYFQSSLQVSVENTILAIKKYCGAWNEPSYFDDFFDLLCHTLFLRENWGAFFEIYSIIKNFASPATLSKFAYLSGRLMQENFIEGNQQKIESAFLTAVACDAGTYFYYRILAAKELGFEKSQIENFFLGEENKNSKKCFENDRIKISLKNEREKNIFLESCTSAKKLLLGYADYGFAEKIYDEWLYFFKKNPQIVDIETTERLAKFLNENGSSNFSKSLRMISLFANLNGTKISREDFFLLYPQNFKNEIESACFEFETNDSAMYALVRTESFFDPFAKSKAGACGLAQLMESTAADCAKKLKVANYDLTNPAQNIRFGTYYFSNLAHRLSNSKILALFAYNAGLSNVRRWLHTSKIIARSQEKNLSDLFLETIPFAETRDYGRRVISATAIYEWLYNEKNPCDIAAKMMQIVTTNKK